MSKPFRLGPAFLAVAALLPLACGDQGSSSSTPTDDPPVSPGGHSPDASTPTDDGGPPSASTDDAGDASDAKAEAAPSAPDSGPKTCGGGGGPNGGPADLFPCDSFWYKDVSALPVAPESAGIIGGTAWGAGGAFKIDMTILYMHDNGTAPKVNFDVDYSDESDIVPVPIPAGGSVEGESGYNCTGGGDCHLIVVNDGTKQLFELYAASNNGGSTWTAAQETVWDLTKSYPVAGRGLGCTSADAAGLSVMAGLIGVRETKAGKIEHALRFILPNNKIRKGPSFVAPATHGTSATSSTSGPPYGTRFRLKASFDESSVTSAGGKAVVRALKKYGMILADGGQIALTAEDDRFERAADPTMKWDGLLDASDLDFIDPSDFEVVDFGKIQSVKSCNLL